LECATPESSEGANSTASAIAGSIRSPPPLNILSRSSCDKLRSQLRTSPRLISPTTSAGSGSFSFNRARRSVRSALARAIVFCALRSDFTWSRAAGSNCSAIPESVNLPLDCRSVRRALTLGALSIAARKLCSSAPIIVPGRVFHSQNPKNGDCGSSSQTRSRPLGFRLFSRILFSFDVAGAAPRAMAI
jgi:hypothetical protein